MHAKIGKVMIMIFLESLYFQNFIQFEEILYIRTKSIKVWYLNIIATAKACRHVDN